MSVFSVVDLVKGFHQIPVAESDIPKTAIITPFGLFEFLRMPFGLKNAAQAFQCLMDGMLRDVNFAFVYLDEILVASPDHEVHQRHLHQLFRLLEQNGININRKKCVFGQSQVRYLGHLVDGNGIRPLPSRIEDLRNLPPPDSRLSVQRFFGMINYYRRFIPGIASILAPLNALTAVKSKDFVWTRECMSAFEEAKRQLSSATLLHHPTPFSATSLTVDVS